MAAGTVVLAALLCIAGASVVSASGDPTPAPAPAAGVASYSRLVLGPSWLDASCLVAAPDGSDWVLANGPGHPWRLIHVVAGAPLQTLVLAPAVEVADVSTQCLAVTPDGELWFPLSTGDIAELEPGSGRLTTFSVPHADEGSPSIAAGPDGTIWFTIAGRDALGRIAPGGAITEFALPSAGVDPTAVLALPDGDVWTNPCTCLTSNRMALAELSASGSLLKTANLGEGVVTALALGPGGEPWFAWGQVPWGIGEITSEGARTLPWDYFNQPTDMVLGPDGRVWWVTSQFSNEYGWYQPSTRTMSTFTAPGPLPSPWGTIFAIALGPGGTVVMTSHDRYLYQVDTGVSGTATSSPVSTLSSSLPTPAQAFGSAGAVAAGAVASMGAILFITFPSNLFNLTFRENYAEIREWWLRRMRLVTRLRKRRAGAREGPADSTGGEGAQRGDRPGHHRADAAQGPELEAKGRQGDAPPGDAPPGDAPPGDAPQGEAPHGEARDRRRELATFTAVVLVGAALGSLLDPHFGSGIGSLYTYIAVALAIFAGAAIPAWVTWAYHRGRHADSGWHLHALPAGLAVAAVCVLISRLTSFEPGYLYGVICGVAFSAKPTARQKGHIVALSSLGTLVVSVLAWLAWVPAHTAASSAGAAFAPVILADFLAAVFVSGLVGTVISLLPLRFLPGWDLHRWHLGAWLGCFGLATFGVVEVLLIPHTTDRGHAPLVTSLVLLVVFGGLSIGLREWFATRRRHAEGRDNLPWRDRLRELLTPVEEPPEETGARPGAGQQAVS